MNNPPIKKKIFFSYAWRDMGLAMRIDSDLRRCGLNNIWRDRINGEATGDFRKEYQQKIDECDYFILLDSPNYRNYSTWCKDEINYFLQIQAQHSHKKLILCLALADGEWRYPELFINQRTYKYIDFSSSENTPGAIYDNESKYNLAMLELCSVFKINYSPWTENDYEQDFLDELKQSTNNKITEKDREYLLEEYRIISYKWLQNMNTVESRINNLITDCEALNIKTIFPYILLGDYLYKKAELNKCFELFLKTTSLYPQDPRPFRWLGTINYSFKNYDKAIYFHNEAIKLAEISPDKGHKKYIRESKLSIICVLLKKGLAEQALEKAKEFEEIYPETEWDNPVIYSYVAHAHLITGQTSGHVYELLLNAISKFPQEERFHKFLGIYFINKKIYSKALEAFEKAIDNSSSLSRTIEYYYDAIFTCHKLGLKNKINDIIKRCNVIIQPDIQLSDNDIYTLGYIYFYGENFIKAEEYYKRCLSKNKKEYSF